jgi:hypothetical protein
VFPLGSPVVVTPPYVCLVRLIYDLVFNCIACLDNLIIICCCNCHSRSLSFAFVRDLSILSSFIFVMNACCSALLLIVVPIIFFYLFVCFSQYIYRCTVWISYSIRELLVFVCSLHSLVVHSYLISFILCLVVRYHLWLCELSLLLFLTIACCYCFRFVYRVVLFYYWIALLLFSIRC